ncbi:MAG TPA: peptidylprolyl isomerase [Chitinophagaceae bacterium]|nr:peptidylprolyl isomerase [Chitinophagaceae bacterium]
MKRIFSEPLLQFFVLGSLLYLLVSFVQSKRERQSKEIVVDNERIGLLITNYKNQMGVLPTQEQLDAMIENYIHQEIAYREAKKMGLDNDDEIIRRRLSQKFDFLKTDLKEIPLPTGQQLKDFYQNNPSLFQTDGTVNFSHIFFTADNSNDSIAKERAFFVLQQLKNSAVQRAPEKGDKFVLQYDYTEQTPLDIKQSFGDKPILDSLFRAPVHTWIGPVQSGYGWHLLYIVKRANASLIPLEANKDIVKAKYMETAKDEQNKKAFGQVEKSYIIKRTYLDNK